MRRLRFLLLVLPCALLVVAPAAVAADPPPPTITITVPGTHYPANTSVAAHITVQGGNNDEIVSEIHIAGQPASKDILCGGGQHVTTDQWDCEVYLYLNTTVYVMDCSGPCSASNGTVVKSVTFWVRPQIGTWVKSSHTTSGRYAVMTGGTQPLFRSTSSPARPGEMCLRHQVQRLRNGVWSTVKTSGCRLESAHKTVDWRWLGSHPRRVSFRVRATFPGDAYNVAGPGVWTYFRFR